MGIDVLATTIRSIFYPTDFSAESELAFAHALKVAQQGKASLALAHINPKRGVIRWSDYPPVRQTLARWGVLDAKDAAATKPRLGIIVSKVELQQRHPLRAILRYLEGRSTDLVVLATLGRRGVPRWLHPSVAEPQGRGMPTMTLFVSHNIRGFVSPEDGAVDLTRILIPVDDEPKPGRALEAAMSLARLIEPRPKVIRLTHVGPSNAPSKEALPSTDDCRLEWSLRSGEVVEQILSAAHEMEADLIVMATYRHNGVFDALHGGTTEQIIRQAPCPVLAVPASSA